MLEREIDAERGDADIEGHKTAPARGLLNDHFLKKIFNRLSAKLTLKKSGYRKIKCLMVLSRYPGDCLNSHAGKRNDYALGMDLRRSRMLLLTVCSALLPVVCSIMLPGGCCRINSSYLVRALSLSYALITFQGFSC